MIEPEILKLATGANFGAITTFLPNGDAQTHVMWVDADADHMLSNTEVHRQKCLNIQRDPRATVIVWDAKNAYRFAEVRGRVVGTTTGPEAREHIDFLSKKYTGRPYNGK